MPTSSPHLSLLKPGTSDPFVTQDIANNWGKIDAAPGTTICTSSTRPTWSTNQTGMEIFETDTGLKWWWTGTAWSRMGPSGLLKTSAGQPAITYQSSDVSNSDFSTFSIVVSVVNVVVPDGNRPLQVVATWKTFTASHEIGIGAVFRSATANTGTRIGEWQMIDDPSGSHQGGAGASYTAWERSGLSPGSYSWSFQFRVSSYSGGGTANILTADPGGPASIAVIEV